MPREISKLLAVTVCLLCLGGCAGLKRQKSSTAAEQPESSSSATEPELLRQIKADPYRFEPHLRLASLLFNQGRFEEAAEEFAVAVNLNPASKDAHAYLGFSLLMLGKNYEALGALDNAALLDPHSVEIKNNLGFAYMKVGEYDKAVEKYQEVLSADPDNKVAHLNLGVIYRYYQKNSEKAVEHYQRYLSLEPDSRQKLAILEWLDEEKRLRASPQAMSEAPQELNEEARRKLAIRYYNEGLDAYKSGNQSEAVMQWQQAVSVDPWHSLANYHLAAAYRGQAAELLRKAIRHIEAALSLEPENSRYLELRGQLTQQLEQAEATGSATADADDPASTPTDDLSAAQDR